MALNLVFSWYNQRQGFDFCRLSDKRLGRLVRFFCGQLGVTGGRLLSIISAATYLDNNKSLNYTATLLCTDLCFEIVIVQEFNKYMDHHINHQKYPRFSTAHSTIV
jgi:hypothetical protein